MYTDLALYIDGKWVGGNGRKGEEVLNPATEKPLAHLPHASKADLDEALAAAKKGFLLALTVSVFLLEVVPLELQRRIVRFDARILQVSCPFQPIVRACRHRDIHAAGRPGVGRYSRPDRGRRGTVVGCRGERRRGLPQRPAQPAAASRAETHLRAVAGFVADVGMHEPPPQEAFTD